MMMVYKVISTFFGVGFIPKGGGTVAALLCATGWYFACRNGCNTFHLIGITILILIAGIWSAGKMEAPWGKDSYRIVIDEVAGMCISLLFIPIYLKYIVCSFLLFRLFDIVKPFFIRSLEKLPLGWGVMADDVLAGVYANLIVQCIVLSNLI